MKFISIEMINFRQYKNEKIFFSVDDEKNVTIIMGDNTSGKTTLEQAFCWCFYGKTSFQDQVLLNQDVARDAENTEKRQVIVRVEAEYGGQYYYIERSADYEKIDTVSTKKVKGKLKVFKKVPDGKLVLAEDEIKELMELMLPEELSKYFFFDGESMQSMSETLFGQKKSEDIKDVIQSIVGLRSLQNLITHLKAEGSSRNTVIRGLNEIIDENGDEELKMLSAQIDSLERDLLKCEEDIGECKEDENKLRKEAEEIGDWLKKNETAKQLQNRIEEYERQRAGLEEKQEKQISKMITNLKELNAINPSYWLYQKLNEQKPEAAENYSNVLGHIDKSVLQNILHSGICLCGEKLIDNSPHYKAIENLLHMEEEIGVKRDFWAFMDDMKRKVEKRDVFLINCKEDKESLDEFEKNLSELTSKIETTKADMETRSDEIKYKMERQREIEQDLLSKEDKKEKLEREKFQIEMDLKEKKEKRRELREIDETNQLYRRSLEMAEAIYQDVKGAYDSVENKVRDTFRSEFEYIYNEIWETEQEFDITRLYEVVPKEKLEPSTGQKYSMVLSFIGTALKMAKEQKMKEHVNNVHWLDEIEQYPLVMDAPLSAFDTTRIHNISKVIPNIVRQWVIFIKDTDGRQAEEAMHDKIGMRYRICKISKTESRFRKGDAYEY